MGSAASSGVVVDEYFQACKEGNNEKLLSLIKQHPEIVLAQQSVTGHHGLHVCAKHGSIPCVKTLVDAGAIVDAQNSAKLTPLFLAISAGDLDMFKYLVTLGAEMKYRQSIAHLWTPLLSACFYGRRDIVEFLVEFGGVDPSKDVRADGMNCLHLAILSNSAPLVKYLVSEIKEELRPDFHAVDHLGRDMMQLAENKDEISDILTASGLKPKPFVVFVIGGPASGKGILCSRLALQFGFVHISVPEILRAEAANSASKFAKEIEEAKKNHKAIPVEVTIQLILKQIQESGQYKLLLDGFPRTLDNINGWNRMAECKDVNIRSVIYLECKEDTLVERLQHSKSKTEKNVDVIRSKVQIQLADLAPVLSYYEKTDRFHRINADREMDKVISDVVAVISSK